ncbi:MAG: ankyrin repeat domain-containing protein, partial [Vicinamibacterales bacterium]|nr:ankyrin repeat domain-containing protein [Vicinamibacterales bacterium]
MANTRDRVTALLALVLCVSGGIQAAELDLVDAVERNDAEAVVALLSDGADVNAAQPDGATALHWAAHWDAVDSARRLLEAGAAVNAVNDLGVAPLAIACRNGNARMVDTLLAGGADARIAEPSGETALMTCARTGSAQAVELLLSGGAVPNASERASGQTALMWAVAGRHTSAARALVEAGADLDARSHGQFTPLR